MCNELCTKRCSEQMLKLFINKILSSLLHILGFYCGKRGRERWCPRRPNDSPHCYCVAYVQYYGDVLCAAWQKLSFCSSKRRSHTLIQQFLTFIHIFSILVTDTLQVFISVLLIFVSVRDFQFFYFNHTIDIP